MSNRHLMGRRKFLVLTSTCAVAAATVGPNIFAADVAALPKRLAVGFASFEENAAVFAASSIPSSDGGFISRGARVSVSGASGAPVAARDRRAVEILAHYSYLDGAERRNAPFRAWACNRTTGCQGNPIGFNVPVDEVQQIHLTVGVETGATTASVRDTVMNGATESTALPLTLSLQNDDRAFKLARGFYVVVPMFDGDSEPRWSAWTLRKVDGRWTLVDGDGKAAAMEHFVLRVDFASK